MVIKQARLLNRCQNFFTHSLGLSRGFLGNFAQLFQQNHKFIAAHPAHGVGFVGTGNDAPRDFLEHKIAAWMAKGVVQGFEVIQINHQQRLRTVAHGAGVLGLAQPLHQHPAVGQAR